MAEQKLTKLDTTASVLMAKIVFTVDGERKQHVVAFRGSCHLVMVAHDICDCACRRQVLQFLTLDSRHSEHYVDEVIHQLFRLPATLLSDHILARQRQTTHSANHNERSQCQHCERFAMAMLSLYYVARKGSNTLTHTLSLQKTYFFCRAVSI